MQLIFMHLNLFEIISVILVFALVWFFNNRGHQTIQEGNTLSPEEASKNEQKWVYNKGCFMLIVVLLTVLILLSLPLLQVLWVMWPGHRSPY